MWKSFVVFPAGKKEDVLIKFNGMNTSYNKADCRTVVDLQPQNSLK